jgi:hypothetical protein
MRSGEIAAGLPEALRAELERLESFLEGEPADRLSTHVLRLAASLALDDAGFDRARFEQEAELFAAMTPQHDRVLSSFPASMGYYLSLRLMTEPDGRPSPAEAVAHLEAARTALAGHAEAVEPEFPRVAAALQRLLTETAGGVPPDDRLWRAFGRAIGDRQSPDWLLRTVSFG